MEIYNGLDTLMSVKGLTSNEAFQAYYDQVLSSRENEALNISGFETWDVPQIDFTYEPSRRSRALPADQGKRQIFVGEVLVVVPYPPVAIHTLPL